MARLHLVRHGQASYGSENYDRLSSLGERQAQILGRHLAARASQYDHAASGEMQRQRDTARLMHAHADGALPEPELNAAFNEYDSDGVFGRFAPQVLAENSALREAYEADPTGFAQHPPHLEEMFFQVLPKWIEATPTELGSLESWAAFRLRVLQGVETVLASDARRAVLVTSAGVIAAVLSEVLALPPERFASLCWVTGNSSVTEFRQLPRGLFVTGFNDLAHLHDHEEADLVTYI